MFEHNKPTPDFELYEGGVRPSLVPRLTPVLARVQVVGPQDS